MTSLCIALLLSQTPNMSLPLVAPGQATMSQFETDYNNSMALIDAHQHTAGQGALVPVGGLSIQTPLPFLGNPATGMGYLGLVDAGAGPSVTLTMWNDGINWWVEDGSGNKIELTANGGLNVTLGDGGSYVFTTITVSVKATVAGMVLANNCLLGPNGASYCFDTAGGLSMTSVDGGQILAMDSYGDTFFEQGGTIAMTSNGGGQVVCGATGCYTPNRLGFDPSYFGNLSTASTNFVENVPDGGSAIIDVGKGANYVEELQYDGGTVAQFDNGGIESAGSMLHLTDTPGVWNTGTMLTLGIAPGNGTQSGEVILPVDGGFGFYGFQSNVTNPFVWGASFYGGKYNTGFVFDQTGDLALDGGIDVQGHIACSGPKPAIVAPFASSLEWAYSPLVAGCDSFATASIDSSSDAGGNTNTAGTVIATVTWGQNYSSASGLVANVTPRTVATATACAGQYYAIPATGSLSIYCSGLFSPAAGLTTYSWQITSGGTP